MFGSGWTTILKLQTYIENNDNMHITERDNVNTYQLKNSSLSQKIKIIMKRVNDLY